MNPTAAQVGVSAVDEALRFLAREMAEASRHLDEEGLGEGQSVSAAIVGRASRRRLYNLD